MRRLRKATYVGHRWIWHPDALQDSTLDSIRSAEFGKFMLDEWAAGRELEKWSPWGIRAAGVEDWRESWLWSIDCLETDGWHQTTVDVTRKDGTKKKQVAWTKKPA